MVELEIADAAGPASVLCVVLETWNSCRKASDKVLVEVAVCREISSTWPRLRPNPGMVDVLW